jgi:hypothetical protein
MSNAIAAQPDMSAVKTLISSSDEAKEMGKWDAILGQACNADAYLFADSNSIHGSYLRGEYTFAYLTEKGL